MVARDGKRALIISASRRPHASADTRTLTHLGPSFSDLNSIATNGTSSVGSKTTTMVVVDRTGTQTLGLPILTHVHTFTDINISPTLVKVTPICTAHHYLRHIN